MAPAPAVLILIQLLPLLIQYAPEIIRALADFWDALTETQQVALERLAAMSDEEKADLIQVALAMDLPRDSDFA